GTETTFRFARTSTRTLGGSNPNRPDSPRSPATCTEKNLVVNFAVPGVNFQAMPAAAPPGLAVEVRQTTGTTTSWGESPPWKYARAPPLLLNTANVQGVARSRSLSTPREPSEVRR